MQPFRAPGEIPVCSRCGVRLELAMVQRDDKGRPMCPPCAARVQGAMQDRKALSIYLPIVFGVSLLLVILMVVGIIVGIMRASAAAGH